MVPMRRESLSTLKGRYRAALVPVYSQIDVEQGRQESPSGIPKHVFDFEDGLRLIVSRERTPNGPIVVHVSASADPAGEFHAEMVASGTVDTWLAACVTRWRLLSGSEREPQFLGLSAKKVPHWYVAEVM